MYHYYMGWQLTAFSIVILIVALRSKVFYKMKRRWMLILIPIYGFIIPRAMMYFELKKEWSIYPEADSFNMVYALSIWPFCWVIGFVVACILFVVKASRDIESL